MGNDALICAFADLCEEALGVLEGVAADDRQIDAAQLTTLRQRFKWLTDCMDDD